MLIAGSRFPLDTANILIKIQILFGMDNFQVEVLLPDIRTYILAILGYVLCLKRSEALACNIWKQVCHHIALDT
jgi:hypothetical protein